MTTRMPTAAALSVAAVLTAGTAAAEPETVLTFAELPDRHGALAGSETWYGYRQGHAQYYVGTEDGRALSYPLGSGPGQMTIEITAEVLAAGEDGGIGLFCCHADDGRRLGFVMNGNGIAVWERHPDGGTRRSMALGGMIEEGGPVTLTMVDGESGFSIFVDGENVTSLSNSAFPKGVAGIYLRGPGVFVLHDITVTYDGEVKGLGGGLQAADDASIE